MMKKIVVVLFLLGVASVTRGQERPPQEGVAPVGSEVAAVETRALDLEQARRLLLGNQLRGATTGRDPFSTSTRMRERAETLGGEPRFVANGAAVPKLSLRGYVEPRGKAPVALIEVEGQGVYVVRAGDTIGLTVLGKSTVLRVQSLEASSARVEAGSLGQVIVVR